MAETAAAQQRDKARAKKQRQREKKKVSSDTRDLPAVSAPVATGAPGPPPNKAMPSKAMAQNVIKPPDPVKNPQFKLMNNDAYDAYMRKVMAGTDYLALNEDEYKEHLRRLASVGPYLTEIETCKVAVMCYLSAILFCVL